VLGTAQKPMDGQSLLPSLKACDADQPRTQYFEITGKVALHHDDWFLSGEDGRDSWTNIGPGGAKPEFDWSLYNLSEDFAQANDLSEAMPEKTAEMIALFKQEARENNVFPLDHRFGGARVDMASYAGPRKSYEYWGKDVSVPATGTAPYLAARSYTVEADLVLDSDSASGAVLAIGSRFGGWSLYLDEGRPAFTWAYSVDPQDIQSVTAKTALPAGETTLTMRFEAQRPGAGATVILSAGDTEYGRVDIEHNAIMFAGGGETLDVGRDIGVPVIEYSTPQGAIEGDIPHVRIAFD